MRPNLLYIFADQWRAHAMGWMKEDQAVTPNIDRFASESIRFQQAYSTFPLCSPHRASLLTGKYPLRAGMWTNCKTGLEEILMLKPQEYCIGNALKDNGYHTGYIGKWHLDAPEQNFFREPASGARNWDAYTPPGERRQGFDFWLSYGADDNHLTPHYWKDSPEPIRPGKWSVEFETDEALAYMERQQEEDGPFALFVSYNPPHLPYELVPEKYYEKFRDLKIQYRENVPKEKRTSGGLLETQTRQYLAAVYGIDQQFGRILDYLKEHHMEEDTLVILSADHGEMMGAHGLMSKNVWYEESIHIPLMMRQKGRLIPSDYQEIFASVDHMPTILELLDIPVPMTCEGYSHRDCILKENFQTSENARDSENTLCSLDSKNARNYQPPQEMFLCSYPGEAAMVAEFQKAGLSQKAYGWRGIKGKGYTYVVYNGYHPGEEQKEYFYDDIKDPWQLSPRMIDKDCKEEMILKCRRKLRRYLDNIHDPFLFHQSE